MKNKFFISGLVVILILIFSNTILAEDDVKFQQDAEYIPQSCLVHWEFQL